MDTFLHAVVNKKFPLLSLVWYLFNVVSGNRHQTKGSNGNVLSITTTGNVFVARWVLPLVPRPILDFVMIHWIHWIQWKPLRENSNATIVQNCQLLFICQIIGMFSDNGRTLAGKQHLAHAQMVLLDAMRYQFSKTHPNCPHIMEQTEEFMYTMRMEFIRMYLVWQERMAIMTGGKPDLVTDEENGTPKPGTSQQSEESRRDYPCGQMSDAMLIKCWKWLTHQICCRTILSNRGKKWKL